MQFAPILSTLPATMPNLHETGHLFPALSSVITTNAYLGDKRAEMILRKHAPLGLFPKIALEHIKESPFKLYELGQKSVTQMNDDGLVFHPRVFREFAEVFTLKADPRQVAVRPEPDHFFLPESNFKTIEEQIDMMQQEQSRITTPGIIMNTVSASELIEMIYLHYKQTGNYILGAEYQGKYATALLDRVPVKVSMHNNAIDMAYVSFLESGSKMHFVGMYVPSPLIYSVPCPE